MNVIQGQLVVSLKDNTVHKVVGQISEYPPEWDKHSKATHEIATFGVNCMDSWLGPVSEFSRVFRPVKEMPI